MSSVDYLKWHESELSTIINHAVIPQTCVALWWQAGEYSRFCTEDEINWGTLIHPKVKCPMYGWRLPRFVIFIITKMLRKDLAVNLLHLLSTLQSWEVISIIIYTAVEAQGSEVRAASKFNHLNHYVPWELFTMFSWEAVFLKHRMTQKHSPAGGILLDSSGQLSQTAFHLTITIREGSTMAL